MSLKSDYNFKLLETEDIGEIMFSESENDQFGGKKNKKVDKWEDDQFGGKKKIDKWEDDQLGGKKHKNKNYDDSSDDSNSVDIDYLFTTEKKQKGGNFDQAERDFKTVYDNSKEYKKNLDDLMAGGKSKPKHNKGIFTDTDSKNKNRDRDDSDDFDDTDEMMAGGKSKNRKNFNDVNNAGFNPGLINRSAVNNSEFSDQYDDMIPTSAGFTGGKAGSPKFLGMGKIAQALRTNQEIVRAGIIYRDLLTVAKLIIEDVEKKEPGLKIDDVIKKSLVLADNPEKYIKMFKALPPKEKKIKKPKKGKVVMAGGFF